jgi:NAD(P)-dependent dehydrogenase (short-subunit alcohol dehydrogenase family)
MVVATARRIDSVEDLASVSCLPAELDVTKPNTIKHAVEQAIIRFGRIDVLVNNAGYGELGVIEEFSDERARKQFETNVFGVLNVQREVLPVMRKQRSGHVLQLSSIAGLASYPCLGMYCATKHALEAISEAMAGEVEEFGIKVTLIEPGRFRTDFAGRSLGAPPVIDGDYKARTEARIAAYEEFDGTQPGDPRKAAQAMIKVVDSPDPPLRLLLGPDAYEWANEKIAKLQRDFEAWKEVTLATDYEESTA